MHLKLILTSFQILALVTVFSSCGIKNKYDNSPHMPYAATKFDVDGLKKPPSFTGQQKTLDRVKNKAKKPLLSMDLPISFMADTVTLPYDVYRLVKETNQRNKIDGNAGIGGPDAAEYGINPEHDPHAQDYPDYPNMPQ